MQVELNFEGLEIEKCNIPTGRTPRVDKKNGTICLVIICLRPKLWSLKCQKWHMVCIFC